MKLYDDEFNLKQEIDRYTSRITRGIRSRKRRNEIKQEIEDYMTDMVTNQSLSGISTKKAFEKAREELGDESKAEELFAAVNNKPPFPSWVAIPIFVLSAFILTVSYFLIENKTYRSWLSLIFNIALLVAMCICIYFVMRFLSCIKIRSNAYKKINKYAQDNNFSFTKIKGKFSSLFKKDETPEIFIENERQRYIIYMWATVRKKKTLRLFDNGLYSYSDNIGYMYMMTQRFKITWPGFLPNGMTYFPMLTNDMVQVPKGMHLIPKIDWETYEAKNKENIKVIMLNPIPFGIEAIDKGVYRKLGDDSLFCNQRIWSASGFLSYLEGLRISGKSKI